MQGDPGGSRLPRHGCGLRARVKDKSGLVKVFGVFRPRRLGSRLSVASATRAAG